MKLNLMDAMRVLLIVLLGSAVAFAQDRQERHVPRPGYEVEGERPRMMRPPGDEGPWTGERPRGDGSRGEGLRGGGMHGGWPREISEEEWIDAAAFMQAHSPNRWKFLMERQENDWLHHRLRNRIVVQYQRLEEIKSKDPSILPLKVQQIEVEDEIFGMVRELGQGDNEDVDGREAGPEVQERLQVLVELQLAERRHHIERLAEALEAERAKLARDEERVDEMVEAQWKRWQRLARAPEHRERDWRRWRMPDEGFPREPEEDVD